MNPFDAVKIARQELRCSDRIKITHLNSPTIAESVDGMLFATVRVDGCPYDTQSDEELIEHKTLWHRFVTSLDPCFALHVTLHRQRTHRELAGEFSSDFCRDFDREYQLQSDQTFYQNAWYITIIHQGGFDAVSQSSAKWWHRVTEKALILQRQQLRRNNIASLTRVVSQAVQTLVTLNPHCLGHHDNQLGYSELLDFLGKLFNAGSPVNLANRQPLFLSSCQDQGHDEFYPKGHLGQWLTQRSVFFGRYIEFKGVNNDTRQLAAMIALKSYSDHTSPTQFGALLTLPCEFLQVNTFASIHKQTALDRMKRHIQKMMTLNDPSHSQIDELHQARDDLQSDRLRMGWHHHVLMLYANSINDLESAIQQVVALYAEVGVIAVRETIGQEPAYWSMLPTHFSYITRSAMINSLNFVDFCSLHNHRQGFYNSNYLRQALSVVETPSRSPFYFNLHTKGSFDTPSSGHTVMIGGNGSGKTVAMCFCDAQLARYSGRSFFFDRDHGCEVYIRACGGVYLTFEPSNESCVHLNPFQLPYTPENSLFVKEWMQQLVLRDHEDELDELSIKHISDCVDYAFTQLAPECRYLSTVCRMLPPNFNRHDRMRRWLHGGHGEPDGEYAYLFDHHEDQLSFSHKMGFDVTHFMDHEPGPVFIALSMYLFHRIEQSLTGQLVSIFLDEGWQYLKHRYWTDKLIRWLPTLRKRNAHVVFATQSPKSVISSELSFVLLDNCATQIYFANPQAKFDDYRLGLNLTEREYQCIKTISPQSHYFLYKQANDSCLLRFPLASLTTYLRVFSSTTESVKRCHRLMAVHGENPDKWLPQFMEEQ